DDPKARWYVYDPLLPDADENGVPDIEEWGDAVDLGADWQEVPDSLDPNNENPNNDYNPDLGDLPDLLGNRVFWTVYNDGTPISLRTPRLQTDPIGIEVQQHTWAFARGDELGNVIFFRYKFVNPTDNFIDDLVFTIWTDPDLGDHEDDLIGSDTTLSLGYIYNDADDLQYGANPPAFGIDFFQGPVVESPGDTALLFRGPHFGVDTLLDHRNLPMTSFMYYINGDPTIGDPNNASIARNYQLGGLDADGVPIDPTQWGIGGTLETDPRFFYSGDPVTGEGWLDDTPADKRFMVNTGPFNLPPWEDTNGNGREDIGEPGVQFIVAAYVVGQGSDALGSVTKLKSVDVIAQRAYNANFVVAGPPPPPVVQTRTSDQKIELIIDLEEQGTYDYVKTDKLFNEQRFEGLRIYQFRSNATSEEVGGLDNIRRIASFDIDNKYGDIFVRQGDGGWAKVLDSEDNLDTTSFDNGAAILKYEITEDAFTGGPLINGTEYYFSVTSFSVNHGVRDVVDPATGDTIEVPFIERDDGPISITGNPNNWLASSSGDLLENSLSSNFITEPTTER
ncbi:MAG: hypothetical protein GWN00_25955, partial [Aliifodinibius sp.]|nr:hypothetical protein [candidate division Zixibacteria bacterium]NIT59537.1 hypothetical protein [Fodinibius sp.]NIW47023.1 hypothetical protein [Gammaproteobacteria bacterium]NIS47550.1 hypothetical protein [candidate division Zixibacteria bacterium]NIU15641.1 hypothetical protein [candidate division Zixibacteria bacterium]